MKVLFLSRGIDGARMLRWTLDQHITVQGIVGDPIMKQELNKYGTDTIELEEASAALEADKNWVDLVVSYQYNRILREPFISAPRYKCINFHPAPLPDYRGCAGCSFAILDKLTKWGCTTHYINEGIDTGAIIEVREFPFIWMKETAYSLKKKTLEVQEALYKDIILRIEKQGMLPAYPQDVSKGRYISKKDMIEAMRIDPYRDDIDAKIQAFWFPPYSGAYIECLGKQYTIVNEVVLQQAAKLGIDGV